MSIDSYLFIHSKGQPQKEALQLFFFAQSLLGEVSAQKYYISTGPEFYLANQSDQGLGCVLSVGTDIDRTNIDVRFDVYAYEKAKYIHAYLQYAMSLYLSKFNYPFKAAYTNVAPEEIPYIVHPSSKATLEAVTKTYASPYQGVQALLDSGDYNKTTRLFPKTKTIPTPSLDTHPSLLTPKLLLNILALEQTAPGTLFAFLDQQWAELSEKQQVFLINHFTSPHHYRELLIVTQGVLKNEKAKEALKNQTTALPHYICHWFSWQTLSLTEQLQLWEKMKKHPRLQKILSFQTLLHPEAKSLLQKNNLSFVLLQDEKLLLSSAEQVCKLLARSVSGAHHLE